MAISNTPSPLSNIIAAKTYNAAWFSGATIEAQITNAIASAVLDGALYVYVPANMLPYNAVNVTFNNTIRMIREGGDTLNYDIKAYGAYDDDVTDASAAVNAAIYSAAPLGGTIVFPPPAIAYAFLGPINLTGSRTSKGIKLLGYGTGIGSAGAVQINIRHTNVGFDCTGSSDISFESLSTNGDSGLIPQTAFLLARDNSTGTAGRHRFYNCRTRGFWSAAALWAYGSEENDFFGCYFYNEQPSGKAIVLTGFNRTDNTPAGLSSTFVTIATGAQSSLIYNFFGGSYMVVPGITADVFYIEASSSININSVWELAGIGGAGRSCVYVDGTNGTSNWVHINGLHGENVGTGLNQKFGILFGNEAVRTHIGWSLRDTRVTVGGPQRTGVAIGTTTGTPGITSAGLFTQTDVGAVIIGAGIPVGTRILSVTNANAAIMNANATATAAVNVEIVFRLVFAPPNVIISNFFAGNNSEALIGGMQFTAAGTSIQDSFIQSNNLIVALVMDRCVLMGLSSFWALANRTNSILLGTLTGIVDASASFNVAGTKVLGGQNGGWATQTAVASKADIGAAPTNAQIASWIAAQDAMQKGHGMTGV